MLSRSVEGVVYSHDGEINEEINKSGSYCFDHSKNVEKLCIRVLKFFLFVFHAKLGTINNPCNGSRDI